METLFLIILLSPLLGSIIAGLFGRKIGKAMTHRITILLMFASFFLSVYVAYIIIVGPEHSIETPLFTWGMVAHIRFGIGFLVDQLTIFMMLVVTFVSLCVHIYSIGYMDDDPGYQRFFCYISGFTFSMLALVMANDLLLLYFGWEAVGLFSYLLIGFWFHREASNFASFKAFLANRVGDLGFLLGIAVALAAFGTLSYHGIFSQVPATLVTAGGYDILGGHVSMITMLCVLLFIGAMGKSAQIPLHIWLEGSMEGPTPISALIHAATMVTAGVFMLARISPLIEHSVPALSIVLVIGSATCFFMGVLALVQLDIKRVIAYSTLSQLGYMMAAQGASAFSIGMFHLMTHASFKALLFLAAGSVIIGMHHDQDMRKMGGLWRSMPVTYICMLIGGLALSAIPPFSGFFSKDLIIDAVSASSIPGSGVATFFVVGGAFLTAAYTFRMFFMVFHGKKRWPDKLKGKVSESPWPVLLALIALAVPAAAAGVVFFEPALKGFFGNSIVMAKSLDVLPTLNSLYHTPWQFAEHAFFTLPFWLAVSGIVMMWLGYVIFPSVPPMLATRFSWFYQLLVRKYFFEEGCEVAATKYGQGLGNLLWLGGDVAIIDRRCVDGSGKLVRYLGGAFRKLQTGSLYHYALVMIIALVALMIGFMVAAA